MTISLYVSFIVQPANPSQNNPKIMPLDLYYFPLSPPSRAVLSTMRHLGLEPNIKMCSPLSGDTMAPEFIKLNPCHAIPVLVDGDFVLNESRAILMYICNKYPNGGTLYPEDAEGRAKVDKMLFFDGTSFYVALLKVLFPLAREKKLPSEEDLAQVTEQLTILETFIGECKYVAGDEVSIADISLATTMPILSLFGDGFIPQKIADWYERVVAEVPDLGQLNDEADYSVFL